MIYRKWLSVAYQLRRAQLPIRTGIGADDGVSAAGFLVAPARSPAKSPRGSWGRQDVDRLGVVLDNIEGIARVLGGAGEVAQVVVEPRNHIRSAILFPGHRLILGKR